jgi:hypothetical protein
LAEKRFLHDERFGSKCLVVPHQSFYWILSLMVEVHGRGGWVGAVLPPSLSPSFHSLFGRVEIHSSFLATYALTCTQTRPFPFWSDVFLLAPIFQTRLLDNVDHSSMAASTRLLHNVHHINIAASTRLLDDR